jgi:hypothetical protein
VDSLAKGKMMVLSTGEFSLHRRLGYLGIVGEHFFSFQLVFYEIMQCQRDAESSVAANSD